MALPSREAQSSSAKKLWTYNDHRVTRFFKNHSILQLLLLVSHLVVSASLWPHGRQHARPPCLSPSPGVCPSLCSLPSSHLILCCPILLLPSIFSNFKDFSNKPSDDQNTGASASASVLLINIQGWSPLRLTGLISFLFKGLSGVFSRTTVQRH